MKTDSLFKTAPAAAVLVFTLGLAPAAQADPSAEELFLQNCSICHGVDGHGIEGLAPPLHNAELWRGLGEQAPLYIAGVMASGLSGRISVQGRDYIGMIMPPVAQLPSEELAAISGYVLEKINGVGATAEVALIEDVKQSPLTHKELRELRSLRDVPYSTVAVASRQTQPPSGGPER